MITGWRSQKWSSLLALCGIISSGFCFFVLFALPAFNRLKNKTYRQNFSPTKNFAQEFPFTIREYRFRWMKKDKKFVLDSASLYVYYSRREE